MASVDNHGYVKHAMVGLLIVTVVPSATLAESKFLSLRKVIPHFLYRGILLLRGQTRCDQGLHKNPPQEWHTLSVGCADDEHFLGHRWGRVLNLWRRGGVRWLLSPS